MDIFDVFFRALKLTFKNPKLWLLGFLAALSGGDGNVGSTNFNFPSSFPSPGSGTGGSSGGGGELFEQLERTIDSLARTIGTNTELLIGLIGIGLCLLVVIGLFTLLFSEIGHGGLIVNAERIENGQTTAIREGLRAGAGRAGALFGQRLLLLLPGLIITLIVVIGSVALFATAIGQGPGASTSDPTEVLFGMFGALFCLAVPLVCVSWIYTLAVQLLSNFGRRAIMIEGHGAVDGLKRGWAVIKANGLNTFLMMLLSGVVRFIFGIVVGVILLAIAVPLMLGIGAVTASASEQSLPIFGLLAALFVIVFIVLSALISSVITTFESALWTLTYRAFLQPRPILPQQQYPQ
jgi:hypothetical protein